MDDTTGATSSSSVDLPLRFQGRLEEEDVVNIHHYRGLLVFRRSLRWAARIAFTLVTAAYVWWVYWWALTLFQP